MTARAPDLLVACAGLAVGASLGAQLLLVHTRQLSVADLRRQVTRGMTMDEGRDAGQRREIAGSDRQCSRSFASSRAAGSRLRLASMVALRDARKAAADVAFVSSQGRPRCLRSRASWTALASAMAAVGFRVTSPAAVAARRTSARLPIAPIAQRIPLSRRR